MLDKYRTIWISDIHLGTRGCQADRLVSFLRSVECDTLYLVGDIVDGWRLKRSWYWKNSHSSVVRHIFKKAKKGTKVIYVPGNHDEFLRTHLPLDLDGVKIVPEAVHETADGRKLLVIHGDEFDVVVKYAAPVAWLGDWAYNVLLCSNRYLNVVRRRLQLPYWSLSSYLKRHVKIAVEYVSKFEEALAREAQSRGVDGVVAGHVHHAEIRKIGDVVYYNDGDWVESCTALVEDYEGNIRILEDGAEDPDLPCKQVA